MAVRIPPLRWPVELTEEGPAEDPNILLGATVDIAKTRYKINAMRVDLRYWEPDFHRNLDDHVYADYRLDAIFEELVVFNDFDRRSVVHLDEGEYIFWMVPAHGEAIQ